MTQRELESKIQEAQDAYYNGAPIMEDHEFDKLWDELKRNYPSSVFLQNVGVDNTDGFEKAQHVMLMGSQNKANSAAEMNKFFDPNKEYVVDLKFDGLGLEMQYNEGRFVKALTRGDGCLDFNTILQTDKGPLKIGDIVEKKIQCKVKAKDLDTNEVIWTPITNWFINKNDFDWYELQTEGGKILKVTGNHLVWLPKKNCFRQVQDLVEGDEFDIVS